MDWPGIITAVGTLLTAAMGAYLAWRASKQADANKKNDLQNVAILAKQDAIGDKVDGNATSAAATIAELHRTVATMAEAKAETKEAQAVADLRVAAAGPPGRSPRGQPKKPKKGS